jgi:peptidoglycan hydrolase CwlO-like protein
MANETEKCLLRIEEKIEHIHKDVEQNSRDIDDLKKQVNMGRGSIKTLIWIGSICGVIAGLFKYGDGM